MGVVGVKRGWFFVSFLGSEKAEKSESGEKCLFLFFFSPSSSHLQVDHVHLLADALQGGLRAQGRQVGAHVAVGVAPDRLEVDVLGLLSFFFFFVVWDGWGERLRGVWIVLRMFV